MERRADTKETGAGLSAGRSGASESGSEGLNSLSADIVLLLHELTSGEARKTEREICARFHELLTRRWNLDGVATYLVADDGELRECVSTCGKNLDESATGRTCQLLAGRAASERMEVSVSVDDPAGTGFDSELRQVLRRGGLAAGVAVPTFAENKLAGVLVAVSTNAEVLEESVDGIRFTLPAITTAIGSAQRSVAISRQHQRIESLVKELRSRTAELEEANRELHRVGRYRSLFLQRMSHELRTPLTSILGFAEILLDQETLTEKQHRFCEKIQASGLQLQWSLNQLVDLSRIEAGQTELFLHEFSMRETLRESCAAVARLAQKQKVTLEAKTDPALGSVVSDEGKLRQVLYNFLAFAIGRSPAEGAICIRVGPAEGGNVRVEICDQGEPLQDPAHVFEPVDVDAPNERGTNMNELGLVIAHRLLRVLGGSVSLHPLSPRGLAVRLTLPALPQTEEAGSVEARG